MELEQEFLGLYIPSIDDRGEETLAALMVSQAAIRSNGQLTDFSDHNPLGVLFRAQAFAQAELAYAVNKLPFAAALKVLELTGATRSLGTRAVVSLRFSLTTTRPNPFEIPAGFIISDRRGEKLYSTDRLLVIPAGQIDGTVTATATAIGADRNLGAFQINQFTQPLAWLGSVANEFAAQGGTNAEPVESAIARGLEKLRQRALISAMDFRQAAELAMGSGSRAKAIGLLAQDAQSFQPGAIHVFCLSPDGAPATTATIARVQAALAPSLVLGCALYVSPMAIAIVEIDLTVTLEQGAGASAVADALWAASLEYLSPLVSEPGESVQLQEMRHRLRFASGLSAINEMQLNSGYSDVAMPTPYTIPRAYSMRVRGLVNGLAFDILRGAGEGPEFDQL